VLCLFSAVLVYLGLLPTWLACFLLTLKLGTRVLVFNTIKNYVIDGYLGEIGLSTAFGDASFLDQNPQATVQFLPVLLNTVYCSFQTLFLIIFILKCRL
jgi:hypothetical protein